MKTTTKRAPKEQAASNLLLSDRQVVVVRPSTIGGSFLARRYRVAPGLADTIAALAGLGQGAG